jgi:hypothetical protein
MYTGLQVKHPFFLSAFNESEFFFNKFLKNTQISNFMKICPVGTKLLHADGRTDMTKPTLASCHFANVPKKKVGRKERKRKE